MNFTPRWIVPNPMRLLSALVRNYRIHRELTLEFDPSRTLIGGPNESGKSTLVEALHRALFLRAKGATEQHRAMVSTRHGGQPEVELRFAANSEVFQLRKRFGTNGTTTLSRAGAPALQGEAAEAELARLLSVPAGVSGRNALGQWSHLWVWQGSSGSNPCEPVSAQAERLLSRLQQEGGAVAVRSPHDARVAAAIASAHDALFTQAGKPKVGTDWDRAETAAAEAEASLKKALDRRQHLEQTGRDFEEASRDIQRLGRDLPGLTIQRRALQDRSSQITALRAREGIEKAAHGTAQEALQRLVTAGERLAELRRLLSAREAELRPATERAGQLAEAQTVARDRAEQADRAQSAASEGTRRLRQRRDFLQAAGNRLEKASRRAEWEARTQQARGYQEEVTTLRQQLAALPSLEPARLRKLQERERAASTAEAVWKSMATGIEVLNAESPVLVGDERLELGATRILTEETEVTAGKTLKLRIRPGGGTGLTEARAEARKTQERWRQDLDSLGLTTLAEAQEIALRRAALEHRLEAAGQWLQTLAADQLPQRLAEAVEALAAAEAEELRRSAALPDTAPRNTPPDEAAARAALSAAEDELRSAETGETTRLAERDAALRTATAATEAVAQHQETLDRQQREMEAWRGQIRLLHELHGDDEVRTAALAAARVAADAAEAQWARTRQSLADLQPELLGADAVRLDRALDHATRARQDAATRLAVAEAALRLDGTEDPEADCALASARAADAAEHLARVRNRASAIRLLHQLFSEEQRALADQFTRPLADRITGYLRCLFGPGAGATITLSEGTFTGLHLSRADFPDGTVPFDSLSGGTREQVAAAVRLALAEILASEHDGTLPVVFDDAFAFSDPERVQTLQRMLDLAGSRGLQVIVLTCTPSDYAALGARQILLPTSAGPG